MFLALMNVEQRMDEINLETTVDHKFDSITLSSLGEQYFLQINNVDKLKLCDLNIGQDNMTIFGKSNKLSMGINVVFFKEIELKTNCKILTFSIG